MKPATKIFTITVVLTGLVLVSSPLTAQTPSESQFINSVISAVNSVTSVGQPSHPVIFSANLLSANGKVAAKASKDQLIAYVDGLKAAGAQRVDLNPSVTLIDDPAAVANYDIVVRHIRELGMQLAINPAFEPHELGSGISFQDFENAAMRTFPLLAARYQPDNFVIVHEPTTQQASMGLGTANQDWHGFIVAVAPLIKAASPHSRLGAGGFQNGVLPTLSSLENSYFQDFATISVLDFMTMDIYNVDTFPTYSQWIQLAKSKNKSIYIEETWAPHYLPNPLPASLFGPSGNLTSSLDSVAIIGVANPDLQTLDVNWLQGISKWASENGLEAVTAFTTLTFFAYGTSGHDHLFDQQYNTAVGAAIQNGQLTATGQAYQGIVKQYGIKEAVSISSASYATLPSRFNPNCGSAANPCNPDTTVAPDALVSAFGPDLATQTVLDGSFPTNLGGTTMTLVDSANNAFNVPLYFVSSGQVNYYVPSGAKPGAATTIIKSADGNQTTGVVLILRAAPGIYTANANGQGVAAAVVITGHSDGSQTAEMAFTCGGSPGSCVPKPISLGSNTDTVVVELFGTGFRHTPSGVTAVINGQVTAPVQFAGAQGSFNGLDQINVQIPRSVAGSGEVSLKLTVQDTDDNAMLTSNTVTLAFQ